LAGCGLCVGLDNSATARKPFAAWSAVKGTPLAVAVTNIRLNPATRPSSAP
jgi:hypothetical protein